MIRALIFDFDGLIVDTESPAFDAWQRLFRDHGLDLAPEVWAQVIGTHEHRFDAMDHLELLHGGPLERDSLNARRVEHKLQLTGAQPLLPGVLELVQYATDRGLRLGVASSSSHQWVEDNLERRGILGAFGCIRCREDVARTKPFADLYLASLDCLGVKAGEAVVFEDSPNGIAAARAAGIFAVAVPNPVTAPLDLDAADMRLDSLAALPPDQLLAVLEAKLPNA
jgi:HAD superfamily hydrolase (TIGR01509 family)